jgi:hypothetical protein
MKGTHTSGLLREKVKEETFLFLLCYLSTLVANTLVTPSLPGSKRLAGAKNSFWTKRSTRSPTVQFVVPQSKSNSEVGLFPV